MLNLRKLLLAAMMSFGVATPVVASTVTIQYTFFTGPQASEIGGTFTVAARSGTQSIKSLTLSGWYGLENAWMGLPPFGVAEFDAEGQIVLIQAFGYLEPPGEHAGFSVSLEGSRFIEDGLQYFYGDGELGAFQLCPPEGICSDGGSPAKDYYWGEFFLTHPDPIPAVPLPPGVPLALTGIAGFAFVRHIKRRKALG
jgi:hypothetical protein